MIQISSILSELGIDAFVKGIEPEVFGLGLASYGPDTDYCTYISDPKFIRDLNPNAVVVITSHRIAPDIIDKTVIEVDNPTTAFFCVQNFLASVQDSKIPTIVSHTASINGSAVIADNNVVIGDRVVIEENVIIRDGVMIGNDVIIRAGSIIGGQEFEYKRDGESIFHVKHIGQTIIEDGVEIGYNSVIGRAIYSWDKTAIGCQTKMSDKVIVGHGAKIGKRNLIGAGSIICGRCVIGNDNWIGPACSISNALKVGSNVHIGIGAVVINDVDNDKKVFGNPARMMLGL